MTDSTLPLKNGCELGVLIERMELPQAKLMWTQMNDTTILGLKFNLPFPDFKHKYFTT